jgi:hypothetical protein
LTFALRIPGYRVANVKSTPLENANTREMFHVCAIFPRSRLREYDGDDVPSAGQSGCSVESNVNLRSIASCIAHLAVWWVDAGGHHGGDDDEVSDRRNREADAIENRVRAEYARQEK